MLLTYWDMQVPLDPFENAFLNRLGPEAVT